MKYKILIILLISTFAISRAAHAQLTIKSFIDTTRSKMTWYPNSGTLKTIQKYNYPEGFYYLTYGDLIGWSGGVGMCNVHGESVEAFLTPIKFGWSGETIPAKETSFNHQSTSVLSVNVSYPKHVDTTIRMDTIIHRGLSLKGLHPFIEMAGFRIIGYSNPIGGAFDFPLYAGIRNDPRRAYTLAGSIGYRGPGQQDFGAGAKYASCGPVASASVWTLRLQASYDHWFGGKRRNLFQLGIQYERLLNGNQLPLKTDGSLPYWRQYGSTMANLCIGHQFWIRDANVGSVFNIKGGVSYDAGDMVKAQGQGFAIYAAAALVLTGKKKLLVHPEPDRFESWLYRTARSTWYGAKCVGQRISERVGEWKKARDLYRQKTGRDNVTK